MKSSPPPPNRPRRQRGVALVLVLCFVVLITGLVVAYFSRTQTTRQLSSASTSATSADLLADSATDVILGGLKQEIADPMASTASTPPPAAVPTPTPMPVYVPTAAKYAVPLRNNPAAGASGDPVPNLVRRSMRADALPAPGVASLASAASSTTNSLNGHSVSAARWNRHYLIPTTAAVGGTVSLAASNPVADFKPPDWVFVTAEKGPDVLSSPTRDANGTVTVTGRFAYAVYDEGGLLDINHTGYPSTSTQSHVGAKPVPSYADLTQLGMTATNVDSLLGWRNFATLQATNTSTSPSLAYQLSSAGADTAYYNLFTSNTAAANSTTPNLLQVPLTIWNNGTDQMFLSRQQLIGYFAAAGLDPKYLQYLGTFSRGLNQPSYVPESNRPQVHAKELGGNDANGNTGITPNFVTARVAHAFAAPNTRYDGTPVVIGEPLVKKRFPLNRLAWLTYKGPSSTRTMTDPDMAALINTYGITADFLKQGTADNIKTYFGLEWGPNPATTDGTPTGGYGWTYSHGSTTGSILNVSNPASSDVASLTPGREPDFFELLKASINPGSIAKTSLAPAIDTATGHSDQSHINAAQQQYITDSSLDTAILQIGANIIDQFDTDGFPTRINYNLTGSGLYSAVYGIENLPYISRVRSGLLRIKEASPAETDLGTPGQPDTRPITNTGVGALMNFPEVWNPHDWDSGNLAQSAGTVGPHSFKIYATTNSYKGNVQTNSVFTWGITSDKLKNPWSVNADRNKSPGFEDTYKFPFGLATSTDPKGGEARTLTEKNTAMTFTMDPASTTSQALFREPTVLYQPGVPSGSQLASTALVPGTQSLDALGLPANAGFFGSPSGLKSDVTGTVGSFSIPMQNSSYVGFYLGAHPLRWYDGDSGQSVPVYQTQFGPVNDTSYILACDDGTNNGTYLFYDIKAVTSTGEPNSDLESGPNAGFGLNGTAVPAHTLDYGVRYYRTVDPRTSRFGMMDPWISSNAQSIAPRQGVSFVSATDGTLRTTREGINSGEAYNFFPFSGAPGGDYAPGDWYSTAMGWYHDSDLVGNNSFRPGLLSQNNPNVSPDGYIINQSLPDGSNVSGTFAAFYYADADGVVRRASAGNVPGGSGVNTSASSLVGLPMAAANGTGTNGPAYSSGARARQMDSRPVILNRPFRSVAELGYVYSGTPWKNLDFFQPESGNAALLDVFCISDNSDANAMTAGQTNLNTHQVPVLQAILAQANKDLWNDGSTSTSQIPANATVQGDAAQQIAQLLVNRTVVQPASGPNANAGPQPLQNISDLVGRWVKEVDVPTTGAINGQASCDGFTADLANTLASPDPTHNIQRFEEGTVRALANAGQTRVWNLMFDIVAQTGRYPKQATTLDQFSVEGEQHYWVHVAIDRYTGRILDKQVEVVKE